MKKVLIALALISLSPLALAQEGDELVRLPGDGALKTPGAGNVPERLVPGGGLILTFDANKDGRIDRSELDAGARAAYAVADANKDASLTALEQISWAEGLPSRDDSLANPVRFDPNLDRSVSRDEFLSVIARLADAYIDEASGVIPVANLEAPEPEEEGRFGRFGERGPAPRERPDSLAFRR